MLVDVIIADDHPLVVNALASLLALENDIRVVSRCQNGREVFAAVQDFPNSILVLDVKMPAPDGWGVMRSLREQGLSIPIVLCSGTVNLGEVLRAARLGAKGVFLKEMPPEMLPDCLREVRAGRPYFDAALRQLSYASPGIPKIENNLTAREVEILRLVGRGLTNSQIAEQLEIESGTVRIHLHRIYKKFGTNNRVLLANYAQDLGYTGPD